MRKIVNFEIEDSKTDKKRSGSVSRVLYLYGHLSIGHGLRRTSCNLPERLDEKLFLKLFINETGSPSLSYLVLYRMGFAFALTVTSEAVSSYLTVSPLPFDCAKLPSQQQMAVYFLWHFPSGHPAFLLGSILPCGTRTFLIQHKTTTNVPVFVRRDRPTRFQSYKYNKEF